MGVTEGKETNLLNYSLKGEFSNVSSDRGAILYLTVGSSSTGGNAGNLSQYDPGC